MQYVTNLSALDHQVMADIFEDPEAWLQKILDIEVAKRRKTAAHKKMAEDVANPDVATIEADEGKILESIYSADGYMTKAEQIISSQEKASQPDL